MALSKDKTWVGGETLTASDLNAEFDNIYDNQQSLGTPRTAAWDMDGQELILDTDGDTSITADSDDRIDIKIGGTDSVLLGHDSTNSGAVYQFDGRAITAQANTSLGRLRVGNTNAITIPTGTTAIAASLWVEEPNLTATGTVTSAATVYIEGAPTEGGTNNYALWVDAGNVQLDGTLTVTGVTTHGGNVVSDTDSTDDVGTNLVRWANLYVDDITLTNNLTGGTSCNIKTGTYTGDGATSQGITGLGFQPKMVLITTGETSFSNATAFFTTDQYIDNNASGLAIRFSTSAGAEVQAVTDAIISLDSDGFTVDDGGSDSHPNTNAQGYEYIAWG